MRFFRPEVERVVRVVVIGVAVGALLLPLTWAYQHRRAARAWRETACTYRLREAVRLTNAMLTVKSGDDACATLSRLGLEVAP
jgi:hypothetical protein